MRGLVAVLLVLGAAAEHKPFSHQVNLPIRDRKTHQIAALLKASIAIKDEEQHTGLMFLKSMPKDEGMIFLSEKPGKRVLYMKDTHIPLSVGWFNQQGVLKEVQDLTPLDLEWKWSKHDDISFGLEMNKGWFAKHALKPDHVEIDMKLFNKAIADRGFDPTVYFPQVRKARHSLAEFEGLVDKLQTAKPARKEATQKHSIAQVEKTANKHLMLQEKLGLEVNLVEAQHKAELEKVQHKLEAQLHAEVEARPKVHYSTTSRLIPTSKSQNFIKKIQPQGGKHYYKPMAAADLLKKAIHPKGETLEENNERKRKAELVAQYSYDELVKAMSQ